MASPDAISVDLPIPTFGGRVTQYDPQTLPVGASPFCEDVAFSGVDPSGQPLVAGVCTRPGMKAFYANPFAGNPTVNYLRTFVDSQAIIHLLSLDGLGNVRDESPCPVPPGDPAIIGTVFASALAQSDSLLNREWLAFSNPLEPGFGIDLPRQWSGANFNRVSQVGPGKAPNVADGDQLPGLDIATSPNGLKILQFMIFSITMDATGLVTAFTDIDFFATQNILNIGDDIHVVGVGVSGYNGDFTVAGFAANFVQYFAGATGLAASSGGTLQFNIGTVEFTVVPTQDEINLFTIGGNCKITGATSGTWDGSWIIRGSSITNSPYGVYIAVSSATLANSGGGLAQPPASISAGLRNLSVCFLTDTNYITKPAPFASWTAAGGFQANVTNIPIGPSNVIARILIVTPVITLPATQGPFFYLDGPVVASSALTFPSFVINDNTTVSYTLNFLDAVLENDTAASFLYNLVELGEVSTFCAYSQRLFACGELNTMAQPLNLEFNGGWNLGGGTGGSDVPLGWTSDSIHGGGGSRVQNGGIWLDAYQIVSGGVLAGMITQPMFQDFLGVPILQGSTQYSVRVSAKSTDPGAIILAIDFFSPSTGVLATASYFPNSSTYKTDIIKFNLLTPASIPSDTIMRLYALGPALQSVTIDRIEPYQTLQPYNNTSPRGSYAEDPESFDGTTGFQIIGAENGYPVRAMFTLLDNKLYYVKELGLFSTQDDGQNEPSGWVVNSVSQTMGTSSPRGVGVGESWAIIAHETGAYIFWGSEPVKITQEIQPDWDLINWNAAQTIYVVVDTTNKRIHIGAPTNGASTPNVEFVCDYSQLANSEGQVSGQDIASHPQAYYSVYNPTKVVAPGKARKWTLWNLTMNCAALTTRSDGSYHLLRGNGAGTGKVYDQVTSQTSDDGVAINCPYQTAYVPQMEDEQALQLGSHRKLFKYLTGYASGSGVMNWTIAGGQNQRSLALSPLNLSNPAMLGDFEKNTNFIGERASYIFGTNAVGAWFKLTKLCPTLQREIITPVRGNS